MKKFDSNCYIEIDNYGLGNRKTTKATRTVYLDNSNKFFVKYKKQNLEVTKINQDVGDDKGYYFKGSFHAY